MAAREDGQKSSRATERRRGKQDRTSAHALVKGLSVCNEQAHLIGHNVCGGRGGSGGGGGGAGWNFAHRSESCGKAGAKMQRKDPRARNALRTAEEEKNCKQEVFVPW